MSAKIGKPKKLALSDLPVVTETSASDNLNPANAEGTVRLDDGKMLVTQSVSRVKKQPLRQPSQVNFRLELEDHSSIMATAKLRQLTLGEYVVYLHKKELSEGG